MLDTRRYYGIAFSFVLLMIFVTGCALYQTSPVATPTGGPGVLVRYALFQDQVAGIAVSQGGRVFVSFPRWDKNPLYSVAEVQADGSLRPYPDNYWNVWVEGPERSPDTHFVSAQSLFIDVNNVLWVLDAPAPFSPVAQLKGAKLVAIDLASGRIKQVITLDTTVVPQGSYLRNVCVDQWGSHAYMSDAGTGALVVTDLESGLSRRVLADDPSTKAERGMVLTSGGKASLDERGKPVQFHVSGITLDAESANLYYHALTARTLYRIQTRYLNDPLFSVEGLGKHVERLANAGPVDGMAMGDKQNLYLTDPEEHAIKRYRVSDNSLAKVAQDDNIAWLNGVCSAPGDLLYVTASQFDRLPYFNNGADKRVPPYALFRVLMLGP